MKPFVWKDRTGDGRWLAIAGIELKRFESHDEALAWATSPERANSWVSYSTELRDTFRNDVDPSAAKHRARPDWWEVSEYVDNLVCVSEPTA